jgi:protein ImuB
VDGKTESVSIGTNLPSHHVTHLFKLFEPKLSAIEPALGIELFLLDAVKVEEHSPEQEKMWHDAGGLQDERLSELLDRITNKLGAGAMSRYLPDEHHWPERSVKLATSLQEKPSIPWPSHRPRPLELLDVPIPIQVAAIIPDYPPMLFRYNNRVHNIIRANGPERIEQEWWLQDGEHRDYYRVEDEDGGRYWIFRVGHYHEKVHRWFLHGFFA